MKILVVDNDVLNECRGRLYIHQATGNFARELVQNNFEVEFFQTKLTRCSNFHTFDLEKNGISATPISRYRSKIVTYIRAYFYALIRILKSDFLYLYYPTNFHYLALFCIAVRKPYGFNIRGEHGLKSPISNFLYRNALIICTVSENFTSYVNNCGGNAFTQLPALAFSLEEFDQISKKKIFIAKDQFELLYVGRLDVEKGVIDLIEACKILLDKGVRIKLTIVGDGHDRELAFKKVETSCTGNYITFVGAAEDKNALMNFYRKADIFVLPSYHEGFPRVIYEAMIADVPIVTSIVGGMNSLMKDGFNCIEIQPRSSEDIAAKLTSIIANYSEVSGLVSNAKLSLINYFGKNHMSHSGLIKKVLNSLVNSRDKF
jgi:glycosyltransferase involved in cell wall biosynthesis